MINIFKLNKIRDEKEVQKYETYRKVLEKCHNRVRIQGDKGITYCIFTIPNIIFGLPAYDQIKCAEYCTEKLRKNGFVVIYTYPNLLYISWEHVPSAIKNPEVKTMEVEIMTNPYRDYSGIVYNLNNSNDSDNYNYFNKNMIEYQSHEDNRSLANNSYSNKSAYNDTTSKYINNNSRYSNNSKKYISY